MARAALDGERRDTVKGTATRHRPPAHCTESILASERAGPDQRAGTEASVMEARQGRAQRSSMRSTTARRRHAGRLLGTGLLVVRLALLDLQRCARCLLQPLHQHALGGKAVRYSATWMPDLSSSSNSICSRFLPVQRMIPSGEASSGPVRACSATEGKAPSALCRPP